MNEKNRKHTSEEIARRMELMAGIFQKDSQIYHLMDEQLEMLQELYKLEMQMYGRMSQITGQIFELEHCEALSNGRVRRMTELEREESADPGGAGRQADKSGTVHGKLGHYKAMEKQRQTQTDNRSKEERKRETPELA